MNTNEQTFSWIAFYNELANKLLTYKNDRKGLLAIMKNVFQNTGLKYPFTDNGEDLDDICPFTVFGSFNKGITNENRIAVLKEMKEKFGISAGLPVDFEGVPLLTNMKAWFFGYKADRQPNDIQNLWDMFEAGINFADHPTDVARRQFIKSYDTVKTQLGVKWNLTMGLFWIRPYAYINLDATNQQLLKKEKDRFLPQIDIAKDLKELPDGRKYLQIIEACKENFLDSNSPYTSFPSLSYNAWIAGQASTAEDKLLKAEFVKWFAPLLTALKELGGSGTRKQVHAKIIENEQLSDDFVSQTRGKNGSNKFENEVDFARNYLAYEDIIDKSTKGVWSLTDKGWQTQMDRHLASDIVRKWRKILIERREENVTEEDNEISDERVTLAWYVGAYSDTDGVDLAEQFIDDGIWENGYTDKYLDIVRGIRFGDRIAIKTSFVQKNNLPFDVNGRSVSVMAIKAIGTVTKNHNDGRHLDVTWQWFAEPKKWYFFTNRTTIWKVETHEDDWMYQALLDFTFSDQPQDYERFLAHPYWAEKYSLTANPEPDIEPVEESKPVPIKYTSDDFLKEVFMDQDRYDTICELLLRKKNIILQGAPGVGKTFAAQRLAFSIMQETDEDRVKFVQFHQNYAYEDFIMGYKPDDKGFSMKYGVFYKFCKKAEAEPEKSFFFIIDEINRGNLSKVFGELLMLIESDKRGAGNRVNLAYTGQPFFVPDNLYIIGMMNTADRSLAIIDYALRRRFCFIELEPAFLLPSFKNYLQENGVPEDLINKIISKLTYLNSEIANDPLLGKGFRIGHSYFCECKNAGTQWYKNIVKYEIAPMLEEYWFDDLDKANDFVSELLR